jgi:uncharacterized membrane protein YfcA
VSPPNPRPVDIGILLLQIVLMFGVAFIYSNLGLGGGLLFVPILLATGITDTKVAAPISLTLTIMTAAASVINHRRKGFVDTRLGLRLIAGPIAGAVAGAAFHLAILTDASFKVLFAVILVVFGAVMVRDWFANPRSVDEDDDSRVTPSRVAGTGVAMAGSGFLSGSLGIGGGIMNVPLLVYLLGRRTRKAIGVSSLLIVPTAAVGFLAYLIDLSLRPTGLVVPSDFALIPILMPVVFVGAYVGSRWGLERLKARSVALIFIAVLFVAAAKLALDILT